MSDTTQESTKRVLKYPDGQAPNVSAEVLKALFDRIVYDLGIGKVRWGRLTTAYIYDRAHETGQGDNINLVEERSSINKNFVSQAKMTWRIFCRGMQLIRAKRFRIGITIEHASGRMTEHGLWVKVNPNLSADPELDDDHSIPVEVQLATQEPSESARAIRHHVPPPDIRKFAGRYPPARAEGRDHSEPGEGGDNGS